MPYRTGKGSPILFVSDLSQGALRVRVALHEIGHATGMPHTVMGIMATRAYTYNAPLFSLFESQETIDKEGSPNGKYYRPIDKLGPAFGIKKDGIMRSMVGNTDIESSVLETFGEQEHYGFPPETHTGLHTVTFQSETRTFIQAWNGK